MEEEQALFNKPAEAKGFNDAIKTSLSSIKALIARIIKASKSVVVQINSSSSLKSDQNEGSRMAEFLSSALDVIHSLKEQIYGLIRTVKRKHTLIAEDKLHLTYHHH